MLMPTVFIAQFKVRLLELSNFFSNHCPIYLMAVNKKGPSGHADFVGWSLSPLLPYFLATIIRLYHDFEYHKFNFILFRTVSRYWCVQKIKNAPSKKVFFDPVVYKQRFKMTMKKGSYRYVFTVVSITFCLITKHMCGANALTEQIAFLTHKFNLMIMSQRKML